MNEMQKMIEQATAAILDIQGKDYVGAWISKEAHDYLRRNAEICGLTEQELIAWILSCYCGEC